MSVKPFKLLAVGVGGSGVLSTVRWMGAAAMEVGIDVRVGQHHGLAQRGGSVEATLVIGPGESGFVSRGEADVVLALEPLEAQRATPRMNVGTTVLLESTSIVPYSLTSKGRSGPTLESIVGCIQDVTPRVFVLEARAAAGRAGSFRSLNVAMLGALAALEVLPIPMEALRGVIGGLGRGELNGANLAAFDLGVELGRGVEPSNRAGAHGRAGA